MQNLGYLPLDIANAAHRAGFAWKAPREIDRLRRIDDPAVQSLATALEAALGETDDEAPARWMREIEALRTALHRSDLTVTYSDHGIPARLRPSPTPSSGRVTRAVREVCRSSIPAHEARVLFHLIRQFTPTRCLELGTCLGLSGAYQAAALALNGSGRLVTLEGGTALVRLARTHFERLGLCNVEVVAGRFQDTLPSVLQRHGPIDYAFIDGHHDPAALLTYYRLLVPHLAGKALLVFDDIFWTTRLRKAWTTLITDPSIQTTVDLLTFGICFYHASTQQNAAHGE
ncbi:MAG: O-methyltransferase [Rhodothermales bacterium]